MATAGTRGASDQSDEDITALKDALTAAEQRAEQAEAAATSAKEELQGFVYAASHDVKEALRSVSAYAQLLVRHVPADGELGEFGQYITEGVRVAVAIIDRLNTYSRIDVAPRKMMVKLGVIAQVAVLNQQRAIQQAEAKVSISADMPEANINESQWTVLFDNLIDNAIKYRGTNQLHIEISGEETEDGIEVSVRDNGGGIQPAYQEMVFLPFKRLHGKDIPGVGLGLSFCRKIAHAHHGKIWVESDGQHGSVFKILLPY